MVFGLVTALAACVTTPVPPLDGTHWRAVQVDEVVALPARPPMITFQGGGASGSGLCSTFTITSVTVDNAVKPPTLAFGAVSTSSGCINDDQQRLDTAFLHALTQARSIEFVGGRLVLDGPGGRIVFEPVTAAG